MESAPFLDSPTVVIAGDLCNFASSNSPLLIHQLLTLPQPATPPAPAAPQAAQRLAHQTRHCFAGALPCSPQQHRAPRLVADVDPGADLQLRVDLVPATRLPQRPRVAAVVVGG